jgi:hypothetical protein
MKIALGKKKSCVSANNLEKNIVGRQDRLFSSLCQTQCELLPSLGIRRLSSVNF